MLKMPNKRLRHAGHPSPGDAVRLYVLNALCGADDVRKGYVGCYRDGDGPYGWIWYGTRWLPANLYTDGITHEQCAHAAGQAGYDVFALQTSGYCFMGRFSDVAQMPVKLDDATCSTTPCVDGVDCADWANKVYSIGASLIYQQFRCHVSAPCPSGLEHPV
jgi:hypothetical protein